MPAGSKVPALPRVERSIDPLPHPQRLFDGGVADGVDGDLKAAQVRVVEDLGQVLVLLVEGAVAVSVRIGSGYRRGPGSERAVQGEISPQRLQAEVHDPGDVLLGHVYDDLDR